MALNPLFLLLLSSPLIRRGQRFVAAVVVHGHDLYLIITLQIFLSCPGSLASFLFPSCSVILWFLVHGYLRHLGRLRHVPCKADQFALIKLQRTARAPIFSPVCFFLPQSLLKMRRPARALGWRPDRHSLGQPRLMNEFPQGATCQCLSLLQTQKEEKGGASRQKGEFAAGCC